MNEIAKRSKLSLSSIKRIISYWLNKEPVFETNLSSIKYLVCDGTYFHKDGCLITLFDPFRQQIVQNHYCHKEGYRSIIGWLRVLKTKGLNPLYISMDGEQGIMRAFKETWPNIKVQRCLFHIQHEGCRWLRSYPKTIAAKELKSILLSLPSIKSVKEQKLFIYCFKTWKRQFKSYIETLPMNIKSNFDLKRTVTLIERALPDMFHYIYDPSVRSTTNILEALHSRIKKAYRQHCGLSHLHKIQFLRWFCYYENQHKTNIF